jgi:NAD(P)-dependent dehydrogenase (short-subunit alcohol dehydrogenase family)
MKQFEGKTAFVTGGGSGIGLGIGRALLDRGMKVVLADLLDDHLDEARALMRGDNRVHYIQLDVTDRPALVAAAEETERVFGPVHVLCNNVGVSCRAPIDEASFADWDYVIGASLMGTANGLVAFLPGMKAHGQGGHIVNTSSMAGMIPVPGFVGLYSTAKYGIRGMSESLRLTLAPYKIGVSVVCPGLTRTRAVTAGDIYREAHDTGVQPTEKRDPITGGMDAYELGKRIALGIERNEAHIFPHGEFKDEVSAYFSEMLQAFPTEFEMDPERRSMEERRAQMTIEQKAAADALDD